MTLSLSKHKSKTPQKLEQQKRPCCSIFNTLVRVLHKIPIAISLLLLIYLWSSSTTIISGNFVHVCVSSRKLNNLYCLSAGTKPNFEIPVSLVENATDDSQDGIVGNIDDDDDNNNTIHVKLDKKVQTSIVVSKNSTIVVQRTSFDNNSTTTTDADKDGSDYGNFDEDNDDERMKGIEDRVRAIRSWAPDKTEKSCENRGVYVYDLPSKFNTDLVGQCSEMVPWIDFCKYLTNGGQGQPITGLGPAWYWTHMYSLELIFHSRALKHPCRVYNESEAKLYYVPFYGGLDVLRWHFKNVSNDVKDSLGLELIKWLGKRDSWRRNSGRDHVFVLGKVSWDFRRKANGHWGTKLLELEEMQGPVKLLIERHPWHANDIGVPHPTYFHPRSDDDVAMWQRKIIGSSRNNLISFAGAARPDSPTNIRTILIDQCTSAGDQKCKFLNCTVGEACNRPESVTKLFIESEFCLQPPGDSPTRKSVFDSLVAGCIPVIFNPYTAYYQYPWHLPEDHRKYSVFIDQKMVRAKEVNVVERLTGISKKERDDMRRFIVYELLPRLVYGHTDSHLDTFQDAFSITMDSLLGRVKRL